MGYLAWFNAHVTKHQNIMQKLKNLSEEEIVDYFEFENMKINEPNFCILYAKNKKCHDIQNLNCYLCACPNFRFKEDGFYTKDGNLVLSYCDISSKDGAQIISKCNIHQDCTNCNVPHIKEYIKDNFNLEWEKIMKECKK